VGQASKDSPALGKTRSRLCQETEEKEVKIDQGMVTIETPQYAFFLESDDQKNPWYVGMQITTSGSMWRGYLCLPSEIENTHRVFNRELTRLGVEIKRAGKRIVPITGVNSDALRTEKGRK
jgi:hypothetical protein